METHLNAPQWSPPGTTVEAVCPVCGGAAPKPRVLIIESLLPGQGSMPLVRCGDCTAMFFAGYTAPAYEANALHPSSLQYYLEQGAGIDVMLGPLYSVPVDSVGAYLEIGCGFGFSVDFAQRQLGWRARGADPSFFATAGRELLGLNLEVGYWAPRVGESFDLIYGSEVIEHLPHPPDFVEHAMRSLSPTGTLVLTTPNAERLLPDAPAITTYSILSPGFHAVLFTEESLIRLFRRAGFMDIQIWKRDATLIARASRCPQPLRDVPHVDGEAFRQYLASRLDITTPGTPLACGYAYRLFKARMHAALYDDAEVALRLLNREFHLRFGLDVTSPHAIATALDRPRPMTEFAAACAFNVVGAMHFQGLLELNWRERPARAAAFFEAAVRANEAVRYALGSVGAADGESEDLSALDRSLAREAASRPASME